MRTLADKAGALGLFAMLALSVGNPGWADDDLSGQVSQDAAAQAKEPEISPNAITKDLTMVPGPGTFSADHLRYGRQVAITLHNPNPYPMRFDTVQRIGKEFSWVIPPNSTRTVAFRYFNPVSDEVRFLSYQDPDSIGTGQAAAAESVMPTTAAETEQAQPEQQQAQEPKKTESKSAVRGYW